MDLTMAPSWHEILFAEFEKPYFHDLTSFVDAERRTGTIYPEEADVFSALRFTPADQVRVVLVGQDPYHDEGQAHGLAFSVRPGIAPPPSLRNIFKELAADISEFSVPPNGCLTPWAKQGVLLLNSVLTVRAHAANSHRAKGWELFTDAVLRVVSEKETPVVFVLWGTHAQKKLAAIDTSRHLVIRSAHPSPLSAHTGFFGSRPFSKINRQLESWGEPTIDWHL